MKKIIVYCPVLMLLLISCGIFNNGALTREEAKEKIGEATKNGLNYNKSVSIDAVVHRWISPHSGYDKDQYSIELSEIKPYLDAGFLKLQKTERRPDTDKDWLIYEITNKGKPFLIHQKESIAKYPIYEVKTFDAKLTQITGIKKIDENNLEADFEIVYTPTLVGKLTSNSDIKSEHIAQFEKYDDGWRLSKIDDHQIE